MCKYHLAETTPARSCKIATYFGQLSQEDHSRGSILKKKSLPIDKDGYCIFHSRDIDWKLQYQFHRWVDVLVNYLHVLDRRHYMATYPPTTKIVDLTGVFLIGEERELSSGTMETALFLKKIRLTDDIQIMIDYADIYDKVCFEECQLDNAQISFNHTTINGELIFTNTNIQQLSFNNTNLNGGLLMNQCAISAYAEFGGMKIQNIFHLTNIDFKTHAFFGSSNFKCESVYLDHVNFMGKADFTLSTFHGDVNIEECNFDQLLIFTDVAFYGPVTFTGNLYEENVLFTSSDRTNKVFYDNVNFTFIDKESEVQERIIFDNVNYYLISGKVRQELAELTRLNKVTIGSGCIKYRVQSPPVTIETNDINRNIAKELAHSFTNYFTASTGKNLGVEFIENSIHSISLFYFSDEDISDDEFLYRLKRAEHAYWDSGAPNKNDVSPESTKLKIDNYVSKLGLLLKMSMFQEIDLWNQEDTKKILQAINFDSSFDKSHTINVQIQNIKEMKIGKVIAQSHSQVIIAEQIQNVEFKSELQHISKENIEQIKGLLTELNEVEMQEIRQQFSLIPKENVELSVLEEIKFKLDQFAIKHSRPILEGIAASVIYDVLKVVFNG